MFCGGVRRVVPRAERNTHGNYDYEFKLDNFDTDSNPEVLVECNVSGSIVSVGIIYLQDVRKLVIRDPVVIKKAGK